MKQNQIYLYVNVNALKKIKRRDNGGQWNFCET